MHRNLYLRLSKKGEPRCHKCGRVLKIGSKYYSSSRKRIYCEECWCSMHFDVEDDSNLVWTWDESKQVWVLVTKEEGGSHVEEEQTG